MAHGTWPRATEYPGGPASAPTYPGVFTDEDAPDLIDVDLSQLWAPMDAIPHMQLPLRVVGTSFVTVEQDTVDELVSNVFAITSFPLGYRIEKPEFGIAEMELSDRPLNTEEVTAAVEAYEPRAAVVVREAPYDPTDPLADRVMVEVTMPGGEDE